MNSSHTVTAAVVGGLLAIPAAWAGTCTEDQRDRLRDADFSAREIDNFCDDGILSATTQQNDRWGFELYTNPLQYLYLDGDTKDLTQSPRKSDLNTQVYNLKAFFTYPRETSDPLGLGLESSEGVLGVISMRRTYRTKSDDGRVNFDNYAESNVLLYGNRYYYRSDRQGFGYSWMVGLVTGKEYGRSVNYVDGAGNPGIIDETNNDNGVYTVIDAFYLYRYGPLYLKPSALVAYSSGRNEVAPMLTLDVGVQFEF